jgi:ADP-heptose:LPS heptosyltransferase
VHARLPAALVIHPGALGDVLLAVPALRAIRAGGAAVTIAAQPRIGALLVALGVADRALDFEALGLEALFGDSPIGPDAPLARGLAEASRVVCWFGARDVSFTRRLRALAPGAVIAPPHTRAQPVWQHLVETLGASLSPVEVSSGRQPIAPGPELMAEGRRALQAIGWDGASRVLVVHPGAGGIAKRWPSAGFAEVTSNVNASLVVTQGPADADAVEAFTAQTNRSVLRLVEPPLPTLAGVLATAAGYLGNDSGVSHLAAAMGTRSLVLFTEAALPWIPWSETARCLTVTIAEVNADERRAISAGLSDLF